MNQRRSLTARRLFATGILGAIAVGIGALGAHWLKPRLSADQLAAFETGVRYHIFHVVAMLCCIVLPGDFQNRHTHRAYTFLFWGIVLFSGSIYLLSTRALLNAPWLSALGPVTPIGGLCFVTGWILIAAGAFNKKG